MKNYATIIKAFHRQIAEYTVINELIPEYPALRIYFGLGTLENFAEVRTNTSSNDILIYLFPKSSNVSENDFYQIKPSPGKTLFIEVSKNSFYADRLSMAVSLIKHSSLVLSFDGRLNKDIFKLSGEIDSTIKIAENNNNFRNADWSMSMSLITANAAAACLKKSLAFAYEKKHFPAVICGAGPSLSSNYNVLRKYREKLFIITVGRVCGSLMENGIVPDLVVEVDRISRWNWMDHDFHPDVPLLCPPNLSPGVVCRFDKFVWTSARQFNLLTVNGPLQIPKAPELAAAVSVIVPAIDFAVKSGFQNITLIGNDLCVEADGMSHVNNHFGSEQIERTEFKPFKGNHGETVYAPFCFSNLKEQLENYINNCGVKIHNSSTRGVIIEHADFIELEQFCQTFAGSEKTDFWQEIPPFPTIIPEKFRDFLIAYLSNLSQIVENATLALKELDKRHSDTEKFNEHHQKLKAAIDQQTVIQKNKKYEFVKQLKSLADDILEGMPLPKQLHDSLPAQLSNIKLRYQIMLDFSSDIFRGLEKTINQIYSGELDEQYMSSLEPYRVNALRKMAIEFVRQNNTEYAQKLEAGEFSKIDGEFEFELHGMQVAPIITRKHADGTKRLWSFQNSINVKDIERTDLQSFLVDKKFNTDDYSLVFLVPCGWKSIVSFNRFHPEVEFIVADPYPELFSELINYCHFTSTLSDKTVVVGIHPKLKRWRKVFQRTVARWKREGRKILIYSPWLIRNELEVASCRVMLEKLIESA